MVHIERTKEWWNKEKSSYDLFMSDFVVEELNEGSYPYKDLTTTLLSEVTILEPNKIIQEIVDVYIKNTLMPSSDIRDAIHLAYTSYYKINFLLTWNCSHLANVNKKEHIRNINKRLGIFVPEIVTPLELRI